MSCRSWPWAGWALLAKPLARRFAALGSRGAAALSSGVAVVVAGLPATARFFGALPLSSLAANLLVLPLVPLFFVPALLALGLGAVWLPLGRAVAVLPQAALELILRVAEGRGRARAHSARAGDGRVPAVPAVDAAQLAAVPGAGAAEDAAQRRRRAAHRTALVMVTGFFFFFMFSFLSGERKENQKRKPEPAWVGPLHPPVSGTYFPRKIILRGFFLPFFFFL